MAVSDQQKLDFLLKKIGYTKTKTGNVDGTGNPGEGSVKQPFAEAIPSPLVVPNSSLWNEADSIPATPPGSDTPQVKVYSVSSAVRLTEDITVSTASQARSWIAYSTYNNTSSARLTNWIDTQFGAGYLIKVYNGDPNSGGTPLSAGATNQNWFFDYSAGVLNFNDDTCPVSPSDSIYIVGYRYIGPTGAPVSGISTFSFLDLTVERNLDVGGISTFTGAIDANGDLDVDGHTNLDNVRVAGVTTISNAVKLEGGLANLEVGGNTGITIKSANPRLIFTDTDHNPDFSIRGNGGQLRIVSDSQSVDRLIISNTGELTVPGNSNFNAGIDVTGDGVFSGNISAVDATFSGDVSIGGTLTYEDVVNVDSVGIITARDGLKVLSGGANIVGVVTANQDIHVGAGVSAVGIGTFGSLDIGGDIDVDGHTNLDNVSIAGVTTFASNIDVGGSIRHLGDTDTKIAFDTNTINFHTNGNEVFRITQGGHLSLLIDGKNLYLPNTINHSGDGDTYFGFTGNDQFKIFTGGSARLNVQNTGVTVNQNLNVNDDLDVDGHTNLDNVSVAGVTTFAGVIEGVAGENKIPSLYSAMTNLPSAGSYHGMFAHVHATGRGYFAHAGNWLELVNKETNGIVGTGTETYSIGHITGTGLILNGDADVDGHTNLDNVSIAGVSTFSGNINLPDNVSAVFGTDDDGSIKHTGTNLQIFENTGNIQITNYANDQDVTIKSDDGSGGTTNYFKADGSTGEAKLFHYGNEKIKTTSTGVSITGNNVVSGDLDVDGHTNLDNVSITGVSTFASQVRVAGQLQLDSSLKVGGSTGTNGQYLRTTGAGVTWASFPTMRTSQTFTASAGQTTFSFTYNVGFLDVYVNGVKLSSSEFTANNGSSVVLAVGSYVGDIVELISFFTTSYAAGSDTGIENLVEDTSPQLGGNLDLLNKFITGTGGVSITGVITATSFSGTVPSSSLSGALPALDGSALTGIVASGSGVVVKNSGSTVGTAGTIDFGNNLSVSPVSAGIVTITGAAGGGGSGISTISGVVNIANDLDVDGHTNLDNVSVSGVSTFSENVNIIRSSGFGALTIQGGEGTNASINLKADDGDAVSYTHLTLPTKRIV